MWKRLYTVRLLTWLFYSVRGTFSKRYGAVNARRVEVERQVWEYITGQRQELPDIVVAAAAFKPKVQELLEQGLKLAEQNKLGTLLLAIRVIKLLVSLV